MLRIVVFSGGWGGEIIAKYLQDELGTVEVKAAIDWDHTPYDRHNPAEIFHLVEQGIREYIGKVDLIVLGGYMVSLALSSLQQKYQEQKFISVGINYYRILKASAYPERITVIMNNNLMNSDFCTELRMNLPFSTLTVPDCTGWEELSNYGELTRAMIHDDLEEYFALHTGPAVVNLSGKPTGDENRPLIELIREAKQKEKELILKNAREVPSEEVKSIPRKLIESDVVLLLNTNLWDLKEDFEALFGYKTRVLDFRQKLLHDVCLALGLRGVDGNRSK